MAYSNSSLFIFYFTLTAVKIGVWSSQVFKVFKYPLKIVVSVYTGTLWRRLCQFVCYCSYTRNSSGDEIANVNFLYDDIVHVLQNTIDSCINSATDRRGYVLERMCLPN